MPASAITTQPQMRSPGRLPRKMLSTGTITTYSAVMNPALEAVV